MGNTGSDTLECRGGSPVEAEVTNEEARRVVHVRGDLGYRDGGAFAKVVEGAILSDPDDIVIDLSELAYLDEHGLAILLAARSFCERRHVGLVLVPGSPQVQRKFDATGTRDVFHFTDPRF
jgi:anti-anti-sigma factor